MLRIKKSLILALSLAILLALVAPNAVLTRAQDDEQVLRVIHPVFEQSWDPLAGGGHYARWNSLWWASPLYFDENGELHPYLFVEWTPNDDFTVWTFQIDPEAVWSDGSPITSEDVKVTWEVAARPATKSQRVNLFISGVQGYEAVSLGEAVEMPGLVAVDEKTLEVTLTAPDPIFHQRIATHLIAPAKASQVRGEDGDEIAGWWSPDNGVVVSGPFMPVQMDLDRGEVIFEPNPNFWGPEPVLDRIVFMSVEDDQTATLMLQEREADAHTSLVTPTIVEDLGPEFSQGPMIPKGTHFWLNATAEPTSDINVRKALIMAINFDEMFEITWPDGPHQKAEQLLNAVEGVDPDYVPYSYDPEAAQEALAASSYGSADNLPKLLFVGISNPASELAAQYMAEQWRQVLGIEQVEMKPQYDDYSGAEQGQIQIFRDDVGARVPDAVTYLQGSIESSSGNAQTKMGNYVNADIDALLTEAAALGVDDPQRVALAQQAQQLFREDYMFIPWYHEAMSAWAMPWVSGMEKNLDWQVVRPWEISIEQ